MSVIVGQFSDLVCVSYALIWSVIQSGKCMGMVCVSPLHQGYPKYYKLCIRYARIISLTTLSTGPSVSPLLVPSLHHECPLSVRILSACSVRDNKGEVTLGVTRSIAEEEAMTTRKTK